MSKKADSYITRKLRSFFNKISDFLESNVYEYSWIEVETKDMRIAVRSRTDEEALSQFKKIRQEMKP